MTPPFLGRPGADVADLLLMSPGMRQSVVLHSSLYATGPSDTPGKAKDWLPRRPAFTCVQRFACRFDFPVSTSCWCTILTSLRKRMNRCQCHQWPVWSRKVWHRKGARRPHQIGSAVQGGKPVNVTFPFAYYCIRGESSAAHLQLLHGHRGEPRGSVMSRLLKVKCGLTAHLVRCA